MIYAVGSFAEDVVEPENEDIAPAYEPAPIQEEKSIFDVIFGNSDETQEGNVVLDKSVTVDETQTGELVNTGTIKVIDRTLGKLYLIEVGVGSSRVVNELTIKLSRCWNPREKRLVPESRSYLDIFEKKGDKQTRIFSGWMISNHPSVSFLEHPKYDISLLKCGVHSSVVKED